MASSRDPKIIKISRGEHEVSPHLKSLITDDMRMSGGFFVDQPVKPVAQPTAQKPLELNLLSNMPIAAPKPVRAPVVFEKPQPQIKQAQKKIKKPERPQPAPLTLSAKRIARRTTVAFFILALAIVTPLKAITTFERLQEAKTGVENLKSSASGMGADFNSAGTHITAALQTFHSANASLKNISAVEEFVLRNTPMFGEQFGVASRLVGAGEHVSMAAASYMQLFRTLKDKSDAPLVERLTLFFEGNRAVLNNLSAAAELVKPIDPGALPENQQKFVAQARDAILALHNDAEYLASAGPVILSTLGSNTPRRYLLIFQNSTELRPTGGFIGSFALIDIEKGEVKNLQVPSGGSYDLQGTLKKHVFAPLPLHIINTRWEFQDANWFPDFPTSARKLMWFLEKSQGPSVDGVIAINASVLPELLSIVGSVKLANGGPELTADTALNTMRDTISTANSKEATKTKPKEIITTAAPAMIETIKSGKAEHFLPLITVLMKSLENRDIQLYAREDDMQKQIAEFGWDGSMRDNPSGDFLSVIATNIGGQKTDSLIDQAIDHQAKISDDGTVTVTVRVKRAQQHSLRALEGGPNISYLRFYVPNGSTLLTAEGFNVPSESLFNAPDQWEKEDEDLKNIEHEIGFDSKSGTRITKEFGHTAFGNWMITTPGSTTEAALSYTLPFKVQAHDPSGIARIADFVYQPARAASYSVYMQRQSGASKTSLTSRVILPDSWRLSWMTDDRAQIAENGALLNVPFTNDVHYGLTANVYATNNNTSQKEN